MLEKLQIRNMVNSEIFLRNYFLGMYAALFILVVGFGLSFIFPGRASASFVFLFTLFILLETLYLSPSIFKMVLSARKTSPYWERSVVVGIVNLTLCLMAITFSSYLYGTQF